MQLSATGRSFYAVGGNAEAARLSGINHERTIVKVFAIHGFFVGIAAILFATQLADHPVDRAAEPRAHHHHRVGGRRRLASSAAPARWSARRLPRS